jgi:REase_MTES_1575/Transcriptional regulator, AbiEi antitoxin
MAQEVVRPRRSIAAQDDPPDARVARFAGARDGVITLAELHDCGISRHGVASRVRAGRLHRLHRGVYAVGHPRVSLRGRFRAAVLAAPDGAALSNFAAAALWTFIPWAERLVEVTIRGTGTRRIEGVRVHRSQSLQRCDVRSIAGIPVTSPARTLLDLAAGMSAKALRRAARQAQALRLVSVRELLEICDRCAGHRGAAKLRAVVADGPAPTASPLEDDLLDLLDGAGIQRPEINAPLRLADLTIIPDYLWRERRLAIEADSVTWHEHKLVREHDADKQAILEAHGYRVVRITHAQLVRRPEQTLARIRAALDVAATR